MFVFVLFCFVFVRISVQIFMLFCCYRNTTTPHSRSSILEHMIIYFVFVVLFLWSRRHLDMCIIVNIMSLICFILFCLVLLWFEILFVYIVFFFLWMNIIEWGTRLCGWCSTRSRFSPFTRWFAGSKWNENRFRVWLCIEFLKHSFNSTHDFWGEKTGASFLGLQCMVLNCSVLETIVRKYDNYDCDMVVESYIVTVIIIANRYLKSYSHALANLKL